MPERATSTFLLLFVSEASQLVPRTTKYTFTNAHCCLNSTIIIAGIDFVLGDFRSRAAQCPKGIVVNMSLGGDISPATDSAAQALVDAGLGKISSLGPNTKNVLAHIV